MNRHEKLSSSGLGSSGFSNAGRKAPPPPGYENAAAAGGNPDISGMVLRALSNPLFHDRMNEQNCSPRAEGAAEGTLARELEDHIFNAMFEGRSIDIAGELSQLSADKCARFAVIQSVMQRLSDCWNCDSMHFVQISIAATRLQTALRRIGQETTPPTNGVAPAILVCHCEGEKHMFPVAMIEEIFRARGWHTEIACTDSASDFRGMLERSGAIAICLSWSDEALANPVARLVEAARTAIGGRNILFLAGGAATQHRVNWLVRKGVDKVCHDAYLGVKLAESFAFDAVCNSASTGTGSIVAGTHAPA